MEYFADRIYIHARIMAIQAGLLKKKDYLELINTKNFSRLASDSAIELTGHSYIRLKERVFRNQIASVIILTGASREYEALFKSFLFLFEKENIKQLLARAFEHGEFIPQWLDVSPYHTVDRELLHSQLRPEDILPLIEESTGCILPGEGGPYEEIEQKLDIYAWDIFSRTAGGFIGEDRAILQKMTAQRSAMLRAPWASRLEHLYQWSGEDIQEFLNSDEGLGDLPYIREQARQSADRAFARAVPPVPEESDTPPQQFIPRNELRGERVFFSAVKRSLRKDFHHIYPVISYLWLLYYQVQNLFRIIEGARFNVPGDRILQSVICED